MPGKKLRRKKRKPKLAWGGPAREAPKPNPRRKTRKAKKTGGAPARRPPRKVALYRAKLEPKEAEAMLRRLRRSRHPILIHATRTGTSTRSLRKALGEARWADWLAGRSLPGAADLMILGQELKVHPLKLYKEIVAWAAWFGAK